MTLNPIPIFGYTTGAGSSFDMPYAAFYPNNEFGGYFDRIYDFLDFSIGLSPILQMGTDTIAHKAPSAISSIHTCLSCDPTPVMDPRLMRNRNRYLWEYKYYFEGSSGYNFNKIYHAEKYIGSVTTLPLCLIRVGCALMGEIQTSIVFFSYYANSYTLIFKYPDLKYHNTFH